MKSGLCAWLEGRWTFLVLGLAYLSTTFAAGTHWLAVPHRLCEVHGTIEHGRAAEPGHAAEPVPAGPLVKAGEREHHECLLGPCARTEAVLLAHAEARAPFVAADRGRVHVPAAPSSSVPLLLLAPSRSPPA